MAFLEERRRKSLWLRVGLALVAGLVWWLMHKPVHSPVLAGAVDSSPVVRTIEIHARQFKFVPAEITLKKGEPVKLVLISDDVPHGLAVAGLPIHADMVKGQRTIITVTPEKTGDFPGRCSKFCGAGHRDMHFIVHVVP
jgi:cytochrome c oxidase subunit 2